MCSLVNEMLRFYSWTSRIERHGKGLLDSREYLLAFSREMLYGYKCGLLYRLSTSSSFHSHAYQPSAPMTAFSKKTKTKLYVRQLCPVPVRRMKFLELWETFPEVATAKTKPSQYGGVSHTTRRVCCHSTCSGNRKA